VFEKDRIRNGFIGVALAKMKWHLKASGDAPM